MMSGTSDGSSPAARAAYDALVEAISDALYWTIRDEEDDDADEEDLEALADECRELGAAMLGAMKVEIVDVNSDREFTLHVTLPENMFGELDRAFDIKYSPNVNDDDF
jgi:hypothetical protein